MRETDGSQLLSYKEVIARTGLPKSTLQWYVSLGIFPKPYVEREVERWIANPVKPKRPSDRERFEAKVEPVPMSGCWLWVGAIAWQGYGQFRYRGVTQLAHRASYRLYVGEIPEEMFVCHHCDVPECVNPDHLFIGTRQDNMRDMVEKDRHSPQRGESGWKAKLTDTDVLEIRQSAKHPADLSSIYGVAASTIFNIRAGRTWKHLLPTTPKTPSGVPTTGATTTS